jgi:hypothetical protein
MELKKRVLFLSLVAFLALPMTAEANMSTTPWIFEIVQNGQEVEITFSVFEDSSEERVLEDYSPGRPDIDSEGLLFPDLSNTYSLKRFGENDPDKGVVFADRLFLAQDADIVTEYTCQDNGILKDVACDPEFEDGCIDCDSDDIAGCHGFCAVAYRYTVIDSCPPPGPKYYRVSTPEVEVYLGEVHNDSNNGLGMASFSVAQSNTSCIEDETEETSDCSVAGVGIQSDRLMLLNFLLLSPLVSVLTELLE